MLKNYPTTQLFFLSLVTLIVLVSINSLAGGWPIYCTAILTILNFTIKIVCAFLLLGTFIEITNGMLFKKIR